MKNIEDIPKNNIFKVPEAYFDTLPSIIQERVTKKENNWILVFRYSLRYALPLVIVVFGFVWFMNIENKETSVEQLLASVSTDDLLEYMQESGLRTEDLLENFDFSQINTDSLEFYEADVPLNDFDLNEIVTELEL